MARAPVTGRDHHRTTIRLARCQQDRDSSLDFASMTLVINGRFLTQDITGVQRVGREFVTALDRLVAEGSRAGVGVKLAVPHRPSIVAPMELSNVEVVHGGRLRGHAWDQLDLPAMVDDGDSLLCLGNVAPVRLLARRGVRVYTMVHDLSYRYFPDAYSLPFRMVNRVLVPAALAGSDHVFTVSNAEQSAILDVHRRLLSPSRITAVQNGGGEGASYEPTRAAPVEQRPMCCLYVGSITRRKNGDGLLRAATELLRRNPDLEFVFAGSTGGAFKEVGVGVPGDVADRARFLGQVNDTDRLESLYRTARCLVFPSFYEASPLPPIEAMARGCVVACSDIPSLVERCGDAASYFDPGDVGSIVRTVESVLMDPAKAQIAARKGFEQAATFRWSRQAEAVLSVMGW